MTELAVVRCPACGGTVRMVAGAAMPSCLFCGAPAAELVRTDPPEGLEQPDAHLRFVIDADTARERFLAFGRSSWWYPSDLRDARLELRRLLVPAWAWSAELEVHWTGLRSAATRSGKAPDAGVARHAYPQVLVPASEALRLAELRALGAWDESQLVPFDPAASEDPAELSAVTRSAAHAAARAEMEARSAAALRRSEGLSVVKTSVLAHDLRGSPVLVPVWIGAYRYGDASYRFLVNGQTGASAGTAPTSLWKVAGAVLAVVGAFALLVLVVVACGGGLGAAGLVAR